MTTSEKKLAHKRLSALELAEKTKDGLSVAILAWKSPSLSSVNLIEATGLVPAA